jgi:hypothetical protein
MVTMHSTAGASLKHKELEVLALAKEANELWFDAVLKAAQIQADRRAKYSGKGDPFTNFEVVGRLMGVDTKDVFRFYQAIKFARLLVAAGDFEDESLEDTLIDLANYSLLEAGFRCRNLTSSAPEQDTQMKFQWHSAFRVP